MDERDVSLALHSRVLEQVFQRAPIALCVLDREFRYVMINDRLAEMNGRPVAEHLGRTVDEIVPAFAERTKAEVRPVMERGQPERDRLFSGPIPANPTSTGEWLASYYPLHGEDGSVCGVIVAVVEVTEFRRIERDLQLSEARFRLALRAGNLGVWDCDLRAGKYFFSEQYKRMLGYEPQEIADEPDEFFRLLRPEDAAGVRAAFEAHLRGDTPQMTAEFRLRHKDGSWRWIRSEGRADRDADGAPVRVSGVHVDITDHKRTEDALRESEQRYRTLVEMSPDAVVVHADDRFLYANPAALRLYGAASLEQLQRHRVLELIHPGERELVRGRMLAAKTQRTPVAEERLLRLDGQAVPIEASGQQIVYEGRIAVQAVLRDISERRRAEEKLRQSEQRLRFHVENTTLAVVEWDSQFVVTRWSDQAERMFGWSSAETVGTGIFDLHLIYDEDVPIVDGVMRRLTDGVTRHVASMNRNWTKDGRVLYCRWYKSGLLDEDGRMASVLSLVEDCTATIQAEQLLRQAKRAAEEANAAKRQFLASMSHEMRTPLTAMIGFTELLAGRNLSAEKQFQYLDAAQRNARMLLRLVDNVLDFSKIEAGKTEIERQDCSLWQILQDVVSATGLDAEEKDLRLDLDFRYPLPDTIRTDPLRLWQILVNLVGNAVKYTEHGGVRIAIGMEAAGRERSRLRFTVSDTGPGIPAEFEERLFEPFAQADTKLAGRGRGVGLGLPIAARLAELLGSRLELDRQATAGAAFSFALDPGPLEGRPMLWAPPEDEARGTETDASSVERLDGRVLLAEDALDTQKLLRTHLENAGLQVDIADDGLAAVQRGLAASAARQPYDLILLDLQMPNLDGFEAASLLRASAWTGPILALSAHATTQDRDRCREAGFDEFLPKPVTQETLLAAVRRYVRAAEPVEKPPAVAAGAAPGAASASDRLEAEWNGLLAMFADQLPPRLALLEQGLRDQDRTRLRQTAHQLAGAAGQFGFPQLAAAARMLERRAADQGPWAELALLLAAVREAAPGNLLTASPAAAPGSLLKKTDSQLAAAEFRENAPSAVPLPLVQPAVGPPSGTAAKRHRVLLADDDVLVRAALRLMVDRLPEFEVVAEAGTGREALERVQQFQPEIALMDIAMPELDGLNATARVAAVAPKTKVIILSGHVRRETVLQALQAGARACLSKDAGPLELEQALKTVTRGETYFGAAVAQCLQAGTEAEGGRGTGGGAGDRGARPSADNR